MKVKKIIWIITSIILIVVILHLYLFIGFSYEYSSTVYVKKLDSKPEQYFNMTYDELDQWPYLKKAFVSKSVVEVPYSEKDQFQELIYFLEEQETSNFMLDGSYYEVSLSMT